MTYHSTHLLVLMSHTCWCLCIRKRGGAVQASWRNISQHNQSYSLGYQQLLTVDGKLKIVFIPMTLYQTTFFNVYTDPELLNNHLSKSVVETRKLNGDLYPPATIHQLLCSILRYMRNKNPSCPNFLDKKDSCFKQLKGTLDAYSHKLHS